MSKLPDGQLEATPFQKPAEIGEIAQRLRDSGMHSRFEASDLVPVDARRVDAFLQEDFSI